MHVPRGRPVHENLSTSYVNLAALLAELQVNEFTGYVSINFWNYQGYVFLDSGRLVNAFEQADGHVRRGREAVDGILSRAQARGGAVSFFQHPDTVVQALAGIINGEIVYKDLASEFTNLERLVERLRKTPETTWYVEVLLERDSGAGVIYILQGKAEAVVSIRETPESADLRTAVGAEGLAVLLNHVNGVGGTFHVYRAVGAQAAASSTLVSTTGQSAAAGSVLPFGAPRLAAEYPDESPSEPLVDVPEAGDAPTSTVETPMSPVSLTDEQYSELVALMGEVVSAIERGSSDSVREGEFRLSLREAFIQIAETFPFLDPFAGEFEYTAGEIVFLGSARPADFVVGLSQALRLTVEDLCRRAHDADVRSRIETSLAHLQNRRRDDFEKFGLEVALEEILGR